MMKLKMPVIVVWLVTATLIGATILTGCTAESVTETFTVSTTITEAGPTETITSTAPATTITSAGVPVTVTATMTETLPPETTTETTTATITETAPLENQVIGMLTCQEAYDMIQANAGNPKLVIIDVRDYGAYAEAHIEGAINLPAAAGIEPQFKSKDRCTTYLIVCESGLRSGVVVDAMEDMGFFEVYDISGGMRAWAGGGFPTVQ